MSLKWKSPATQADINEDIKLNILNVDAKPLKNVYFDEAIRMSFRAFKLPNRVKLCHLSDVFRKDLPIWSASPGLPWIQDGYKKMANIKNDPDAIQKVRLFWHRIKVGEKLSMPDCCAFVGSDIVQKPDKKVKAVWVYPATVTFGEAVFALPLIEAYKKDDYPIVYDFETGKSEFKKISNICDSHFVGIDFKNFGKTLPAWLIKIAFDVLALNIDFVHYEGYGIPICEYMLRMYEVIRDYYVHANIEICNGERYRKSFGLANGSYFTQLIDSICNYILLMYVCLKFGAIKNF